MSPPGSRPESFEATGPLLEPRAAPEVVWLRRPAPPERRLRTGFLFPMLVAQEWMTPARGLGLGEYDFAVVFDVLAAMSGMPPSKKATARDQ